MENKPTKNQVSRLPLYIGYGAKGRALLAQIKALSALKGKSIRKLVIEALEASHGPFQGV
jgi:hypothetical protein